jgi:hypothetical protein
MLPKFSTEEYLTAENENSSIRLKTKCKKIGTCCFGICLLASTHTLFFIMGLQYNKYEGCNITFIEDI